MVSLFYFMPVLFVTFKFVGEFRAAVYDSGSDMGTREHRLQQTENLHVQLPLKKQEKKNNSLVNMPTYVAKKQIQSTRGDFQLNILTDLHHFQCQGRRKYRYLLSLCSKESQ